MKHLDRHIRKSVIYSMLVVIALIVSMDLIFALVEELTDVAGDYTVANALLYVALTIPTSIYELLPFTALGGALIGLGILASNNELIIIQSAGVSNWRIVGAVLKPTAFIMVLSLVLGEYIAPPLEQLAISNRAVQISGTASINSESGTWRRVGNEFIHINAIAPGGELLYGLSRYRIDDNRRLTVASFAASAEYVREGGSPYWQLREVESSHIEPGRIRTTSEDEEAWRVDLSPELLSVLLVSPDRQSISGLYRFANFFEAQGLDGANYFLAFWKKLLQPLSTLALVLLAISFVFGPLRGATMGFKVFVALAIGLVFTILQRMMEPTSLIYGFSPLLAVMVPVLLAAGAGVVLMWRVR